MSILRKLRRWCPQPTKPILSNSTRLSSPVIAGVLFVEIVALLIAPMAYFALFPPHVNYGVDQTFPLSNSQIAASWPNLPTANQIVKSGDYGIFEPGTIGSVKNCTELNLPIFLNSGPAVIYDIWLPYNGTWIEVPNTYLATNNPPPIPSMHSGFLGTGLPTVYVTIAVIVVLTTLTAGTTYLILHKKSVHST
jgi:hypothetical protein